MPIKLEIEHDRDAHLAVVGGGDGRGDPRGGRRPRRWYEAHTARLHAANPALNAVVVDLTDQALDAARAADRAQAAGAELGPLHGVPVTIKINIDVTGQANSNGVVGLKDNIAPGDSPVVSNLRGAGAIVLGMTNTPEFSMRWFTDNPLHGATLSPWDPAFTCGGSSGGAGASVAAGIGAIAHGNDIGGSLRWPASCNGVSTIKSTQGRIPAFNPSAPVERPLMAQFMSTQGPLAREVADVRLALEVMSRRDPRDPWWVPAPLVGPPLPKPIKVAVAPIPEDMEPDAEVMSLIDQAAGYLSDAGYAVERTPIPDLLDRVAAVVRPDLHRDRHPADGPVSGTGQRAVPPGAERHAGHRQHPRWRRLYARHRPAHPPDPRVAGFPGRLADHPGARLDPADAQDQHRPGRRGGPSAPVPQRLPLHLGDQRPGSAVGGDARRLVGGLPVGAQLIASRYREDLCLDAAAAIEARVGVMARTLWAR